MQNVQAIMTTAVITIQASALVSEAIELMKTHQVHALIIAPRNGEQAYGIVTEADIAYKVIAPEQDPKALTVGDIMTKPCITTTPNVSVENLAQLLVKNQIHRVPVVEGGLLGIVSTSDILQRGEWWSS